MTTKPTYRNAILVTGPGASGLTNSKVIDMLGRGRVNSADWIGVQNRDRTVRVFKDRLGRTRLAAPASIVPDNAVEVEVE